MRFAIRDLLAATLVCALLITLGNWIGPTPTAILFIIIAAFFYTGKLAHQAGRARYFYICLAAIIVFPLLFLGLPNPYIIFRILVLVAGVFLLVIALRYGHWCTRLIGALTILPYVATAVVATWWLWPTANTLVRQAELNDVVGMRWSMCLGVNPNDFQLWGWHHDCEGETAITSAARTNSKEAIAFLLRKEANPDLKNAWGYVPLCIAVRQRNTAICHLLIEHGADPNQCESPCTSYDYGGGWNALDWALFLRNDQLTVYLKANGAVETGRWQHAKTKPQDGYNH